METKNKSNTGNYIDHDDFTADFDFSKLMKDLNEEIPSYYSVSSNSKEESEFKNKTKTLTQKDEENAYENPCLFFMPNSNHVISEDKPISETESAGILAQYLSKYTIYKSDSFHANLKDFIYSKEGNNHFTKNEFNNLPVECFMLIFKTIKEKYISLLRHHYTSYFCQHLFFKLTREARLEVLSEICDNIEYLYKNNNGQCSIIFIFENDLSNEEKQVVLDKLNPKMMKLIWKPMFMRVLECLIVRYPLNQVRYIIEYAIDNMGEFLKLREGYFVIRIIVKSVKMIELQARIIDYIANQNNFFNLAKTSNGSLIFQCIIYNFPLDQCFFEKSCSKHISSGQKKHQSNQFAKYDKNNYQIIRFMKLIISNRSYFDHKLVRNVVECAIKQCPSFEVELLKQISHNSNIIPELLHLSCGLELLEMCFQNFSELSKSQLIVQVKLYSDQYFSHKSLKDFIIKFKHYLPNQDKHKKFDMSELNLAKANFKDKKAEFSLYDSVNCDQINNNSLRQTNQFTTKKYKKRLPNPDFPISASGVNPTFNNPQPQPQLQPQLQIQQQIIYTPNPYIQLQPLNNINNINWNYPLFVSPNDYNYNESYQSHQSSLSKHI